MNRKIVLDDQLILYWTIQKYEYYLAARTLWIEGQMQMSALMYAYAIEAQLKCALNIFDSNHSKELRHEINTKHNIPHLFKAAKSAGIFTDVLVSDDFLTYIQDGFERRYPRQSIERGKLALKDGRLLALICDVYVYYDRLVIDMDISLTNMVNVSGISIFRNGIQNVESEGGKYFFKDNSYAFLNMDFMRKVVRMELDHYTNLPDGENIYQCHLKSFSNNISIIETLDRVALNPVLHQRYLDSNIDLGTLIHPGRP